jgi:DNA-binding NarL/FixJ family response regulator
MDVIASQDPLRVVLVADDPLVRAGLAHMLEALDDDRTLRLDISREVASLTELRAALMPDAVLIDLGVDLAVARERLRDLAAVECALVALVPAGLDATELLASGLRAALPRSADAAAIRAALGGAAQGLVVLDPALLGELGRRSVAPTRNPSAKGQDLTARELEVLRLLAEALPNKLIADRLGISDHTAKFHVNSVLSKLSAGTRTEAVVRAARLGIVTL